MLQPDVSQRVQTFSCKIICSGDLVYSIVSVISDIVYTWNLLRKKISIVLPLPHTQNVTLWGAGCVVQVFSSSGRSWELHGSSSSLRATPGLGLRVRLCLSAFPARVLFLIYPICRSHSDGFWVIFRRKCSVCYLTCDTSTERRNFRKSPGSPS